MTIVHLPSTPAVGQLSTTVPEQVVLVSVPPTTLIVEHWCMEGRLQLNVVGPPHAAAASDRTTASIRMNMGTPSGTLVLRVNDPQVRARGLSMQSHWTFTAPATGWADLGKSAGRHGAQITGTTALTLLPWHHADHPGHHVDPLPVLNAARQAKGVLAGADLHGERRTAPQLAVDEYVGPRHRHRADGSCGHSVSVSLRAARRPDRRTDKEQGSCQRRHWVSAASFGVRGAPAARTGYSVRQQGRFTFAIATTIAITFTFMFTF